MKNTIRTISLAVLTLSGADADAHLKKCSLCKVGENKAGASGAVCTVDEFTVNKGCQDCLLAGEKPTEKTWCQNWAEPVKACADCVATEGSTWCESVMGSPECAKKGVTNTCDKTKDGKNVPAVTTLASCPRTKKDAPKCFAKDEAGWCADGTYPKVESFGQCPKDAGRAAEPAKDCKDCVQEPGPDPDCVKCDFDSGKTWCWSSGLNEGKPLCGAGTNTCDKNADGQNVPAVTAKASCPVVPIPKMYSWEKDGGGAQCETCVNKPKTTTTTAPNANCAACDFSKKSWCWSSGLNDGEPLCGAGTNTCDKKDGKNVPAVTELSGCPMVTTNTTTTPYLWCKDQSCKMSCTGESIDKANEAKCTAKTKVSKPYKYCAATKKCGHDTATTTFACTGDVVDASNFLTKCPRATGSKIATGATKETCGKTNTYSNGKWEAAKKCTSIESELLPQTTDDCAAFGKGLTGCCARKAPKKNGTKASSGSMVHPSVGAGIGAGIMALVAGLV